jgi:hypothetical protein
MDNLLVDIGSRELLLQWLQKEKGKKICEDETFSYYEVVIYGRILMYRQKTLRKDGRRCYFITEGLARSLGFPSLNSMKIRLSTIRYWKKFVSVQRIQVAFQRYDERQQRFRQMAYNANI